MDSLRQSYKDFLNEVIDVPYRRFDDDQKLKMCRIIYKLKSWLLKSDNIDSFICLYGDIRLYQINVVWKIHRGMDSIENKYLKPLFFGEKKHWFALDYVKYIVCHDIHSKITIDAISKCINKYKFNSASLFFRLIALYEGADDEYYLTLLEEFGNKTYILKELYKNANDKELFMATVFKHINVGFIAKFVLWMNIVHESADVLIGNMLSNKHNFNDIDSIACVFRIFEQAYIPISYSELICDKRYIDICRANMNAAPANICRHIALSTSDDVSFLKFVVEYGRDYSSQTIKLAKKHGNIKCAKYMKKHLNKK